MVKLLGMLCTPSLVLLVSRYPSPEVVTSLAAGREKENACPAEQGMEVYNIRIVLLRVSFWISALIPAKKPFKGASGPSAGKRPMATQPFKARSSSAGPAQGRSKASAGNATVDSSVHPSWAAKRAQTDAIAAFKGTRITFDD